MAKLPIHIENPHSCASAEVLHHLEHQQVGLTEVSHHQVIYSVNRLPAAQRQSGIQRFYGDFITS